MLEGREIYCTGLCSDKCFVEAAKQICTVENNTNKPRYVSSSRSTCEDARLSTNACRKLPVAHISSSETYPGKNHFLVLQMLLCDYYIPVK